MYRLANCFRTSGKGFSHRSLIKHSVAVSRSNSSGPVHDVHYETSFHKDGKGLTGDEKRSLPDSADVVVIGGGSVGCSTAYHLAKLNAGRVILIEKDWLTSGTTWHTAGIVFNLRDGQSLTQMQVQTKDLLADILPAETGFDAGWIETGALFVTRNKDQLDGLEKKSLIGTECGVKSWMVDTAEISRLHPLMNTKEIIGGIYSPHDGSVDPATLCTSYIKAATKYGAEVFEKCEVKNIKTSLGVLGLRKVAAVETSLGTVKTNYVVNCTGAWAPYIAKMVGVELPQLTYKHTYVITQSIPGIEKTPHVRDTEKAMYHKRQGDALLFGGYEKDPDLVGVPDKDFSFGLYDMNWERFEPFMESAISLVPSIEKVGIRSTVCGPESFTPDNRPLLGETPDVRGFYVGSAFNSGGMMMGGGAGRQIAHWIVHGAPEFDMQQCDINRFTRKRDETWLVEVCYDSFTTRYDVERPHQQKLGGRNLITTPLTEHHIENGAYFNSIHGWEVPMYFLPSQQFPLLKYDFYGFYGNKKHENYGYRDHLVKDASFELNQEIHDQIVKESLACCNSAGIMDLSHLSKFSISGPNADHVARVLFTTDVTDLKEDSKTDSLMMNNEGKIEGLVSVLKLEDGSYQIIAASELQDFILRHINQFLLDRNIDCEFEDETDKYGLISVVGPKSAHLLENVATDLSKKRSKILRSSHNAVPSMEIQFPMEQALEIYKCLLSSDVKPEKVGMRALNSLCLEAGVHGIHTRYLSGVTPYEAKLMELCPLDDSRDYVGKEALKKLSDKPLKAALVRLKAKSEMPICPHDVIWRNGEYAGIIEDAAYGCQSGEYHIAGFLKSPPRQPVTEEMLTSGNFAVGRYSYKTEADLF